MAQMARIGLLIIFVSYPTFSARADFDELGILPGGDYFLSQALAVSGDGKVVVGSGSIVTQYDYYNAVDMQAVRWENGAITSMKPLVSGHERSVARGVSYGGSVITGTIYRQTGFEDGGFVWANGAFSLLGDLLGGPIWSGGYDVSDDGTVIAGFSIDGVNDHAIEWVSGALNNLGVTAGHSYARGVSADGMTLVGFDEFLGAIRWDEGVASSLARPPGDFGTQAFGISADGGTIVGRSLQSQGDVAARWEEGVPVLLGTLPGHVRSIANDASSDGTAVVGYSADTEGYRTAVVWDETQGIRSLYDILDLQGDPVAGWTLREAHAISDDGTVIVGVGVNPYGYERGFKAVVPAFGVPEPSVAVALVIGVSFLGFLGARAKRFA